MGAKLDKCCSQARDRSDEACGSEAVTQLNDEAIISQASDPLSKQEIALLKAQWAKVEALGVETVGVLLFKRIFTIAPNALGLFSFRSEPNILTFETPGLKAHGARVVNMVGVAVGGLDDLRMLAIQLEELGTKHVGYGVKPPHYEVVGKALLETLAAGLGSAFTPKAKLAWTKAWTLIASSMQGGSDTHPGSQGKGGPLLKPGEKVLVEQSWGKASKLGVETVGVLLFRHIFTIAPEAMQLFPFKDEPDVYNCAALKKHASKVVETVGTAVGMLGQLEELVPILQDLGKRHVKYGVLAEHYGIVGQALISTLRDGLGKEFTPEVEGAWRKVYGIVSSTMKGDNYS